jgi:hypothetical protein
MDQEHNLLSLARNLARFTGLPEFIIPPWLLSARWLC